MLFILPQISIPKNVTARRCGRIRTQWNMIIRVNPAVAATCPKHSRKARDNYPCPQGNGTRDPSQDVAADFTATRIGKNRLYCTLLQAHFCSFSSLICQERKYISKSWQRKGTEKFDRSPQRHILRLPYLSVGPTHKTGITSFPPPATLLIPHRKLLAA